MAKLRCSWVRFGLSTPIYAYLSGHGVGLTITGYDHIKNGISLVLCYAMFLNLGLTTAQVSSVCGSILGQRSKELF